MSYTNGKKDIVYRTNDIAVLNKLFAGGYITINLDDVARGSTLKIAGEFMADEIECRHDRIILSGTMMEQFEPGPKSSLMIQGNLDGAYWRTYYEDDDISRIDGHFQIDGHLIRFSACYEPFDIYEAPIYQIQKELTMR